MIRNYKMGDEVTLYPISKKGMGIIQKHGNKWKIMKYSKKGKFIILESINGVKTRFNTENEKHFGISQTRGDLLNNMNKKSLLMKGKKCKPIILSKENIEYLKALPHKYREIKVTEHEYYDHMIKENELIENYEECHRLLNLKNNTPYSEKLTRTISR